MLIQQKLILGTRQAHGRRTVVGPPLETEAVAQSHHLFSHPRPIREKGVACESSMR